MEFTQKSTKNRLCQLCQHFATTMANNSITQTTDDQMITNTKTPTLPTLPLYRYIYLYLYQRSIPCQSIKIINKYYYYIEVLYTNSQLLIVIIDRELGIILNTVKYRDVNKCRQSWQSGKLRVESQSGTGLYDENQLANSWQTWQTWQTTNLGEI